MIYDYISITRKAGRQKLDHFWYWLCSKIYIYMILNHFIWSLETFFIFQKKDLKKFLILPET